MVNFAIIWDWEMFDHWLRTRWNCIYKAITINYSYGNLKKNIRGLEIYLFILIRDEIVPFELLTLNLTFIFILGQKSLASNARTGGYYIRTKLNFLNCQVGSSKFTRYFLLNFLLIYSIYIYIYLLFIYLYLLILPQVHTFSSNTPCINITYFQFSFFFWGFKWWNLKDVWNLFRFHKRSEKWSVWCMDLVLYFFLPIF